MAPFILDMHGLPEALSSPDGKRAVFVRDYNLWVRDKATGKDKPLTTNGSADEGYGLAPLGIDTAVQARWSPDSKRLLTVQLNTQGETQRPFVFFAPEDGSLNPQVTRLKMGYPGDEHVNSYRLCWIEIETGDIHPVDYPALPCIALGVIAGGFSPQILDGGLQTVIGPSLSMRHAQRMQCALLNSIHKLGIHGFYLRKPPTHW